ALRLRLPLSLETLPAAWAVRVGGSGTRAGQDYRQVPVLVAWHAVPGTAWMVIAKTDRAEVLAPLRQQAWLIAAAALFALIASACAAWVLLRRRDMAQRLALLGVRLREADAIQTSERKFRTLIDNLPDIAWHKDAAGVYVSCNRRYAEALHLDSEAIAGQRDDDFYPPELAAKYQADDQRVLDTGLELDSEEHWLKDGQPVWLHTRKAPVLDNDGRCVGTIGIARDVTAHKQAELALQAYRERLEVLVRERTADLEAANADLEGFSYSVSHDLRAPLRAIDGFAAILREDYAAKLDAEGLRLFQVVSDNARKMGQLIDDILAFSRAGRRELQQAELDMAALVGEVWQGLDEARWPGREVDANPRDLRLGKLPSARGDPVAIRQVWLNLLGNALKFTRGRAPAVIEVGGRREGAENWYYVKDNGAGFDPAYSAKLFGLFSRLHGMDEFEGTGVGLAIVKRFIAKHGGRVWAEGRVGEGATFWFSLPAAEGEE
ncbi:MAG: PAS domain-containing protein, partial [Pseudomonadota bacterium]|nr:PAS domain-containing protein [Pseudomonadota bacterium]